MKFGSLFAGIGGLDIGLERAGMTCAWQIEYDPTSKHSWENQYNIRVLNKHWPEVKKYGDITKIDKSELEQVDLICGGFPCQPFSLAGKRKGTDDARWLWPEFLETIRKVGPEWVLVENVPGLLTNNDGRAIREIERNLAEMGYCAWNGSLRAADVGANHRRERVFIVAHNASEGVRELSNKQSGKKIHDVNGSGEDVADTDHPEAARQREHGRESIRQPEPNRSRESRPDVGNADIGKHERKTVRKIPKGKDTNTEGIRPGKYEQNWAVEPNVGRVADGVPNRVDRLKCLGNAVVPQVAEYIGRCIMEVA